MALRLRDSRMTNPALRDCFCAPVPVRVRSVQHEMGDMRGASSPAARPSRSRALSLALGALLLVLPAGAHASREREAKLPGRDLLERALAAYQQLDHAGRVANPLLTVIDYSLPSSAKRLWVIDPETRRVLHREYVTHGRGSSDEDDPKRLIRYGNAPASHRTSRGVFLTGDTYTGQHGHSLELHGLERGVNDRAFERRIVIHPADYASASYRKRSGGHLGRSHGCPALDPSVSRRVIDRIAGGSVLFVDGAMKPVAYRTASYDSN
jgi:hypothetical protein